MIYSVGITGYIGSGKTSICRIFEVLGIPVFYSDIVAKSLYLREDVKVQIRERVGEEYFDDRLEIDINKLREILDNPSKLEQLNKIIHPLVFDEFEKWKQQQSRTPYVLLESAILYQNGYERLFDKMIWVETPKEEIIKRVMKRNNISREEVVGVLKRQEIDKNKIQSADFRIDNREEVLVTPQVINIHQLLKN